MTQSKRNYYNSVRTLPVENFYYLNKHNDLRFLIKSYDEFSSRKLTDDESVELETLRNNITQEYIDILSEGKGHSDLLIVGQISDLEIEIMIIGSLLTMMRVNPSEALKIELKEWKYPEDLDKAEKKHKGVSFRLSILKSKNKHLFEKDDSADEVEYDLFKDVVLLEQSLSVTIDPKTCVLEKWANYLKVARDKNKKIKSNGK